MQGKLSEMLREIDFPILFDTSCEYLSILAKVFLKTTAFPVVNCRYCRNYFIVFEYQFGYAPIKCSKSAIIENLL